MKFWSDFRKFLSRGNVLDMAVGVVIGGAFGKIVTGLVNFIMNPFVGLLTGGISLDGLKTVIQEASVDASGTQIPEVAILWGSWIQTIVDFLIISLCIFAVIRGVARAGEKLHAKEIAEKAAADKAATEKTNAEAAEAEKAKAEKEAENAKLRASLLAQEKLLTEIRDAIRNK